MNQIGQVKSVARVEPFGTRGRKTRRVPERILKGTPAVAGYLTVRLSVEGRSANRLVQHLVLEAFVGPRPSGQVVRHLNDVKTDNRLSNLQYGTYSENMEDAIRNGMNYQARKTHCVHGHEYTPVNTYRAPSGQRVCRTCTRERSTARHGEKKRA